MRVGTLLTRCIYHAPLTFFYLRERSYKQIGDSLLRKMRPRWLILPAPMWRALKLSSRKTYDSSEQTCSGMRQVLPRCGAPIMHGNHIGVTLIGPGGDGPVRLAGEHRWVSRFECWQGSAVNHEQVRHTVSVAEAD